MLFFGFSYVSLLRIILGVILIKMSLFMMSWDVFVNREPIIGSRDNRGTFTVFSFLKVSNNPAIINSECDSSSMKVSIFRDDKIGYSFEWIDFHNFMMEISILISVCMVVSFRMMGYSSIKIPV